MVRYYDSFQPELWLNNSLNLVDINKLERGIGVNATQLVDGYHQYLVDALSYQGSEDWVKQVLEEGASRYKNQDGNVDETPILTEKDRSAVYESLAKEDGESLFDAYKKMVSAYLIESNNVSPRYKEALLKQFGDRIYLLTTIINHKNTDDIDKFFSEKNIKAYTPEELQRFDEGEQPNYLTIKERDYLIEKLQYASIPFYEMKDHDSYFSACVDKLMDESEVPNDHVYMHIWERKVAGTYKTQAQHQETMEMVIAALSDEELSLLNKAGGSIYRIRRNKFVWSEDGASLFKRLKELRTKNEESWNPNTLLFDVEQASLRELDSKFLAHLKSIFSTKDQYQIEQIYKQLRYENRRIGRFPGGEENVA